MFMEVPPASRKRGLYLCKPRNMPKFEVLKFPFFFVRLSLLDGNKIGKDQQASLVRQEKISLDRNLSFSAGFQKNSMKLEINLRWRYCTFSIANINGIVKGLIFDMPLLYCPD
jgi:hypothetical protein